MLQSQANWEGQIIDIHGRVQKSFEMGHKNEVTLNLKLLGSGPYFIRLYSSGKIVTRRIQIH